MRPKPLIAPLLPPLNRLFNPPFVLPGYAPPEKWDKFGGCWVRFELECCRVNGGGGAKIGVVGVLLPVEHGRGSGGDADPPLDAEEEGEGTSSPKIVAGGDFIVGGVAPVSHFGRI